MLSQCSQLRLLLSFIAILVQKAFTSPVELCHENPCQNEGVCMRAGEYLEDNFCPNEFVSYGGQCYKFVQNAVSWNDAKRECRSQEAFLVSVENKQEQKFVQAFVTNILNSQKDAQVYNVWTGGKRRGTSKTMRFAWDVTLSGRRKKLRRFGPEQFWAGGRLNPGNITLSTQTTESPSSNHIWTGGEFLEQDKETGATGYHWIKLQGPQKLSDDPESLYWDRNQPPSNGDKKETCVAITFVSNYMNWAVQDCDTSKNFFICKTRWDMPEVYSGEYNYQCRCKDGFAGRLCEIRPNPLSPMQISHQTLCEDETLSFACPKDLSGEKLSIVVDYAAYGRATNEVPRGCESQAKELNCVSNNALLLMIQRCQGLPQCSLPVLSEVFPTNPCLPGTSNFLEYRFRCQKGQEACPTDSYYFRGRCYRIGYRNDRTVRKSWNEARQQCAIDGGDLIGPINREVHLFLLDKLKQIDGKRVKYFWIGLKSEVNMEKMSGQWSNGMLMDFKPKGSRFLGDENQCIAYYIQPGRAGRPDRIVWLAKNCGLFYNWICEFSSFGQEREKLTDPTWNMTLSTLPPIETESVQPETATIIMATLAPNLIKSHEYNTTMTSARIPHTNSSENPENPELEQPTQVYIQRITAAPGQNVSLSFDEEDPALATISTLLEEDIPVTKKAHKKETELPELLENRTVVHHEFDQNNTLDGMLVKVNRDRVEASENVTINEKLPVQPITRPTRPSTQRTRPPKITTTVTKQVVPSTTKMNEERENATTSAPIDSNSTAVTKTKIFMTKTIVNGTETREYFTNDTESLPVFGTTENADEYFKEAITVNPTFETRPQITHRPTNRPRPRNRAQTAPPALHNIAPNQGLEITKTRRIRPTRPPNVYIPVATDRREYPPTPPLKNSNTIIRPTQPPFQYNNRSGPQIQPRPNSNQISSRTNPRENRRPVPNPRPYINEINPTERPTNRLSVRVRTNKEKTSPPISTTQRNSYVPPSRNYTNQIMQYVSPKKVKPYYPEPSLTSPKPLFPKEAIVTDTAVVDRSSNIRSQSTNSQLPVEMPSETLDKTVESRGYSNSYTRVPTCDSQQARGLIWPATPEGAAATVPCPPGTTGSARWFCRNIKGQVTFYPPTPDLSECRHPWVGELEAQLARKRHALRIGEELALNIHQTNELYGGDFAGTLELVNKLIPLQRAQLVLPTRSLTPVARADEASNFIKVIGESSDKLMSDQHIYVWNDFPQQRRYRQITSLMQNLETGAEMLTHFLGQKNLRSFAFGSLAMKIEVYRGEMGKIMASPPKFDYEAVVDPQLESSNPAMTLEDAFMTQTKFIPGISFDNSPSIILPDIQVLHSFRCGGGYPATSAARRSVTGQNTSGIIMGTPVRLGYFLFSNLGGVLEPDSVASVSEGGLPIVSSNTNTNNSVTTIVNSHIIGATVNNPLKRLKLPADKPVTVKLMHLQKDTTENPKCVFWNVERSLWDATGCRLVETNRDFTICSCNHLTSFAVLMDVRGYVSEALPTVHQEILKWLTMVGCGLSSVCLFISICVFTFFRSLWGDRNTIHRNLCICLLIAELLFLCGIDRTEIALVCKLIAAFMHYFFLAAFCWMLMEGYHLYIMLIKVFEPEKSKIWLYHVFSYGVPAVIVGIALGIQWEDYGTPKFCWINVDSWTIYAFVGPIALVLCFNVIVLCVALRVVFKVKSLGDKSRIEKVKGWLKGSTMLLCLLGLTWTFGFLFIIDPLTIYFAYLFTILNCCQGIFIFLFHVVLNKKVHKLCGKHCGGICPCCIPHRESSSGANHSSSNQNKTKHSTIEPMSGLSDSTASTGILSGRFAIYSGETNNNRDGSGSSYGSRSSSPMQDMHEQSHSLRWRQNGGPPGNIHTKGHAMEQRAGYGWSFRPNQPAISVKNSREHDGANLISTSSESSYGKGHNSTSSFRPAIKKTTKPAEVTYISTEDFEPEYEDKKSHDNPTFVEHF